jgi:lysylphosphatidylglycerol synthetase-like protein (DUF2156 family)
VTTATDRLIFWVPRLLAMAFIAFLSLFSLDVFGQHAGIWTTLRDLLIHNIPVFILITVLVLAWRWEWIGALLFAAAGSAYLFWLVGRPRPALPVKLQWAAFIAGPAFLVAALFLAGWLRRIRSQPNARS